MALFPLRVKVSREQLTLLDQLRAAGLPDPEPEYAFAKTAYGRDWRFDWCWRELKLALEVEGALFGGRVVNAGTGAFEYRRGKQGQKLHVPLKPGTILRLGGRHNTGAGLVGDLEKYAYAAILGWCVIRVSTTMVRDGLAAPLVEQAFRRRGHVFQRPEALF
jgi:hypothetical protein